MEQRCEILLRESLDIVEIVCVCVCIFCKFCALFMGPASTKFCKINFKTGSTILFTYLKIILLQYFQFSIFSNKRYPNRPYIFFFFLKWSLQAWGDPLLSKESNHCG